MTTNPRASRKRTRGLGVAAVIFASVALGAVGSALSSLSPRGHTGVRRQERAATTAPSAQAPEDRARAQLGKRIFFDARLSEPPGTSCASCHDPRHGFAGNHGSAIGIAQGSRAGHFARRNTPSVMYLGLVHRFHFHWEEDAALPDGAGGFFWDGRSDSLATLVEQPLLNPDEMNGGSRALVADKLRAADYAEELRHTLGATALDTPDDAMHALGVLVEAFLRSDELSPYSSRFDDSLRGRATLTAEEQRGLALFRDPAKGNCGFCHKVNPSSTNPARSPFTDHGFETVGVPRNPALPAREPDLGLCTARPAGAHTDEARFCGGFRTPSLRNVATRSRFMHNGFFTSLRDVVAFYATRSSDPARWYPSGVPYDDLPERYRGNVNELVPPYDRGPGEKPRLDDSEIDAIVTFLRTLTDAGHEPPAPAAPVPVRASAPAVTSPPAQRSRRDIRTLADRPQFQTEQ